MPFIPRGHVPLTLVVQRLIEQFTAEASAGYERAGRELQKIIARERTRSNESEGRTPLEDQQDSPEDAASREVKLGYIREIERYFRKIWDTKQVIVNILQQDLGMGDTRATSVFVNGDILEIPARAWRTKIGEQAVLSGRISWADSGIGMTPPADAFVADAVIERWIEMVHSAVRDMVGETASIPTTGGQSPTAVVGSKFVNRRADISSGKACQWMLEAATAAQDAGESFGRDAGVERCQAALNCTREVARAAYLALPGRLKQPRGKAIRKPA